MEPQEIPVSSSVVQEDTSSIVQQQEEDGSSVVQVQQQEDGSVVQVTQDGTIIQVRLESHMIGSTLNSMW